MRLRLDLAYDGSGFHGWARQPGLRTVQGTLEAALATVLRVPEAPLTVAGRTDTGVHARGQVAHLDLAKDWRTDRYLRRLEAMLLVADKESIFTVTGVGDVLEPEHGVAAVGSGGNFALSAARALIEETDLDAEQVARKAMKIAAEICVYTNGNLTVETLGD